MTGPLSGQAEYAPETVVSGTADPGHTTALIISIELNITFLNKHC
jgi:hypothetical protein